MITCGDMEDVFASLHSGEKTHGEVNDEIVLSILSVLLTSEPVPRQLLHHPPSIPP